MASFEKRPSGWRVKIRKAGQVHSGTFPTKAAAQSWATGVEADILAGRIGAVADRTVKQLIQRYVAEVTPTKGSAKQEGHRLLRTCDDALGKIHLSNLSPSAIEAWRDRRLQAVSVASVLREWNSLSAAFTHGLKVWRWIQSHPMTAVKRPAKPQPRQRLWTDQEIELVLTACGDDYSTAVGRVGLMFRFALETAMRAGEICNMSWPDVHDSYVHLPKTKTKVPRDVPLSSTARELLDLVRPYAFPEESVFGVADDIRDALFRKARGRALVTGVRFHDARANALTRLSRVLNVMQLARVSGHRDLRILQQVYYRESASDIANLLG